MSSQPKYADLVNIRKNCFLLMCSDIQSGTGVHEPSPNPSSLSPESSLQQTIEYYSQDGGDGTDGGPTTDETARFKALNIPEKPEMNWKFKYYKTLESNAIATGLATNVDKRFTKGIPNVGNSCYCNTALQLLLCNQDFIQLLIQGNCKANFIDSVKLVTMSEEYKQKYLIPECGSMDFEQHKKILTILLKFFKTWIENAGVVDESVMQPIIHELLLTSKIVVKEDITEQQDSSDMAIRIVDALMCIDSEYTNKCYKNLTFEYNQQISLPYQKESKPASFILGSEKTEIKTSLQLTHAKDIIVDENYQKKTLSETLSISDFLTSENIGEERQYKTDLDLPQHAALKISYEIVSKAKLMIRNLNILLDKTTKPDQYDKEIQSFNSILKKEEFKNFLQENRNKPTLTDVISDLEKINSFFTKNKISSVNNVVSYNKDNSEIITKTYKKLEEKETDIEFPPGRYFTTKNQITEVNKYLLVTFNREMYIKATGNKVKDLTKIDIEKTLDIYVKKNGKIIKKKFILQGYSLHFGMGGGGHYVFVKCNYETGKEELVLNDPTIEGIDEIEDTRCQLNSKDLPIPKNEVLSRSVVAFIYKLAEEEEPAPAGGPPPAVTSGGDIRSFIQQAIGDTGNDYDSDDSDGGGAVKKYRKNTTSTGVKSCMDLKYSAVSLRDNFLVKVHAIAECYSPEYYFPAWVCSQDDATQNKITDCLASAKVYYDKGDSLKDVVTLAVRREPSNMKLPGDPPGTINYDKPKLECMFGYSDSPYANTSLNIAVYTKTPYYTFCDIYRPHSDFRKNRENMQSILLPGSGSLNENPKENPNYPFMHVVHAYAPAFDSIEQPDYQRYAELNRNDDTQETARKEYKKDIQKMLSKISKAYDDFKKDKTDARLILTGIGQANFALQSAAILGGDGTETCNNIYRDCVKEFFKNDDSVFYSLYIGEQPYTPSENDPFPQNRMLVNIDYIGEFVIDADNQTKLNIPAGQTLGDNILWVNAWDPFSMLGNGNYDDGSVDGYFGRKTAIAVIGWPVTNPDIMFEEIDYKAILLQKTAPPGAGGPPPPAAAAAAPTGPPTIPPPPGTSDADWKKWAGDDPAKLLTYEKHMATTASSSSAPKPAAKGPAAAAAAATDFIASIKSAKLKPAGKAASSKKVIDLTDPVNQLALSQKIRLLHDVIEENEKNEDVDFNQLKSDLYSDADLKKMDDVLEYMKKMYDEMYECGSVTDGKGKALCIQLKNLIVRLENSDSDWGGGGHIKKKLIRKKTYRNLNKVTNNTSRKKTKLTEVFKTKRNKNKTLRKK